jgi:intein/homing endonuclease
MTHSNIEDMSLVKTKIKSVYPIIKQTLIFNNDESTRVSLEQPVLVEDGGNWKFVTSDELIIGNKIMSYNEDNKFVPLEIIEITKDESPKVTYAISVEDHSAFIAGNIICRNKQV